MEAVAMQKRQALIDALLAQGYEADPRGNLTCTAMQHIGDKLVRRRYRIKFQDISVRVEIQGLQRHPIYNTLPWLRVTSCYYTQIVYMGDGRLKVGTLILGKRAAAAQPSSALPWSPQLA